MATVLRGRIGCSLGQSSQGQCHCRSELSGAYLDDRSFKLVAPEDIANDFEQAMVPASAETGSQLSFNAKKREMETQLEWRVLGVPISTTQSCDRLWTRTTDDNRQDCLRD